MHVAPGGRLHSPGRLVLAAQQKVFWPVVEQVDVPPKQTPAVQLPPDTQPRVQVLPSSLFSTPQTLFVQVARIHGLVGGGQSLALRQQFATGEPP
jgi:hypothetical protein